MADVNWLAIKNEYINTNISYRKLAEKYSVSFATLRARAKKEDWVAQRTAQQHKVSTAVARKSAAVVVKKEVDRVARVTSAADALLEKLEQAIGQLDNYIVTNKRKIKTVEYDNKSGKLSKEVTTETENLEVVDGVVDRLGLRQLASALKDLKDVQLATAAVTAINESEDDPLTAALKEELEDGLL